MRISIATKLLSSFFLILALSFAPAFWYLRRDLMNRVLQGVEVDLAHHAQLVANRLAPVPDAQLDVVARDISTILVDRISIVAPDGRVLGESAVPARAIAQLENHLDREEVQEALQRGYGSAVRTSPTKGEPYLYVARVLRGEGGKVRGVVRLSRPLGVITKSFQGAVTFLHRAAGVAASLVLIMGLGATLYTVRPLLRLREAAQAYARGEFNHPLPKRTGDEVGDLGESMAELARRVQQERVDHSTDAALRSELVRALPVPVLLLGPDRSPRALNAPFREAAEVDPAHEAARVHQIAHLPEVEEAMGAARIGLQPQPVTLSLPWRRGKLPLRLCPLPAPRGEIGWAIVGTASAPESEAAPRALRRAEALVSALEARDPREAARRLELRVLLGLLHPGGVPQPSSVTPLEIAPLLRRILEEFQPVLAAAGVSIELEEEPPDGTVADSDGRVERVLRASLWRALGAIRPPRRGPPGTGPGGAEVLQLAVYQEKTAVLLRLRGLQQALAWGELDPLLSPLGGGVGATREAASGAVGESTPAGSELWIQLRRA